MPWALKWRSENALDGRTEHLIGRHGRYPNVPSHVAGYVKLVFQTRDEARAHLKKHFGYIGKRSDLMREPHGWKSPIVVKVEVKVTEIKT